jgi:O-antigen ligase
MKFVYIILLSLTCLGITLSDFFLQNILFGLNQSYLVLPLILFSLIYYKKEFKTKFFKNIVIYIALGIIIFSIYGFKNFELLSNLTGTVLVAFSFYNFKFTPLIHKYLLNTYIIIAIIFCVFYYIGYYEVNFSGRSSFIGHNENYLSQLLNIGLAFSLYKYFQSSGNLAKRVYLFSSISHILPIFSTGSRTGITLMIITLLIIFWNSIGIIARFIFIVGIFIFFILDSTYITQLSNKSEYVKLFVDRASDSKNDERGDLWNISLNLAKDNFFTGVGFDRFYDENWRRSVGLYYEIYDSELGRYYSQSMSVHNSYLDLIMIGGVWLLFYFNYLFYYPLKNAVQFLRIGNLKYTGLLILILLLNVVMFSFTGQGATQKITWLLIGVSYFLIDSNKRIVV